MTERNFSSMPGRSLCMVCHESLSGFRRGTFWPFFGAHEALSGLDPFWERHQHCCQISDRMLVRHPSLTRVYLPLCLVRRLPGLARFMDMHEVTKIFCMLDLCVKNPTGVVSP